jgi:outer membrane protein
MNSKIVKVFIIILLLVVGSLSIYSLWSRPKTGYISLQEVYNGFNMKIEMQKKYTVTVTARQKRLDSLQLELKSFAQILDANKSNQAEAVKKFEVLRDQYLQQRQAMEEDNKNLTAQFDKEILTQLNQYVKDFGKENGYDYLFGNDGNGSLMFGSDKGDLSKQVIEYINKKYAGK